MIKHIVFWNLKPEAEGKNAVENAARIKQAGEGLRGKIPGLVSIEISTMLGSGSTVGADIVLQSSHNSYDDLKNYAVHPLHLEILEVIKACTENRRCLDYEI